MRIATSLVLMCAGAILATAIEFDIPGIDLGALGTILFLVGMLGLAVTVGLEVMANRPWDRPRREPRRRREEDGDFASRRPVEPPYDPVMRPSPSPPRRGAGPEDPTRVAPRRPPPGGRR